MEEMKGEKGFFCWPPLGTSLGWGEVMDSLLKQGKRQEQLCQQLLQQVEQGDYACIQSLSSSLSVLSSLVDQLENHSEGTSLLGR